MKIQIEEITHTEPKKVIGTQITQSIYEQLKREADSNFMSISDLLRKIIHRYLDRFENTEEDKK